MLQCFVKEKLPPEISRLDQPLLVYVSRVDDRQGIVPRVMHRHDDLIELILVYKGQGHFTIDGRQILVRAGDLIVYNSGITHDEGSDPDSTLGWYCAAFCQVQEPGLRPNALMPDDRRPVYTAGPAFDALFNLYELLFCQLAGEQPGHASIAHHLAQALLETGRQVIRLNGAVETSPGDDAPLALRLIAYLDSHYMESIRLQDLARIFRVSPFYLAHVFKSSFGYSPMQYRLRRRIGEAQSLLLSTDLAVTEIAAQVGYDNSSHFNRQFSKFVGLPPLKYRLKYLKTIQPDPF